MQVRAERRATARALCRVLPRFFQIVNADQGCHYTCKLWSDTLFCLGIRDSMDSRRRCNDNIWIERFWCTLKRECVYLNPVYTVCQMRDEIARYINTATRRASVWASGAESRRHSVRKRLSRVLKTTSKRLHDSHQITNFAVQTNGYIIHG